MANETDVLLSQVAAHLAGRSVLVKRQIPYIPSAEGCVWQDRGVGLIEIAPGLSDYQLLDTLCHEAAHIRYDWRKLPEWGNRDTKRTFTHSEVHAIATNPELEPKAERQAAAWMYYAEINAWGCQRPGDSDLQARCRALLRWKE